MLTTLTLRRSERPLGQAVAWFFPGDNVVEWLDEIATWDASFDRVRFYLCPVGIRDDRVGGILAIPPEGTRIPRAGRALPYRAASKNVYVPLEAELWPPVDPEELAVVGRFSVVVVHPAFGVTGCDEHDGRHAWELLYAPPLVPENWTLARHGHVPPPPLRGIQLTQIISLAEIFGPESEDIGSLPAEELPPLPGEASDSLPVRLMHGAQEMIVSALLGLTALVPRSPTAPRTFVNALEEWARRQMSGDLDQARQRELHRLLEMLQKNPEEGLRHAIPLAALANRGVAPPGSRLGQRPLDFALSRLGGGRAADVWNIPDEIRSSLAQRYRAMAMRELKLGRHRRAACIYAELLGDLSAAADALRQGHHFQEAAVLYRERLRNPIAAAGCLAEAGLLIEAIELYEQHHRWLDAADLYARLGDSAAAAAAVRKEVRVKLDAGDAVVAAQLLERRLSEVDEALEILAEAWPAGKQAFVALEERFAVLARHRRDDQLRREIAELADQRLAGALLAQTANLLAKFSETSTDARIRTAAKQGVWIKVARGLGDRAVEGADEIALCRALARIAPGDKLLVRDIQRFRDGRRQPRPLASPAPQSSLVRRITVHKVGTIQLGEQGQWLQGTGDASGYCAVAAMPDRTVTLVSGTWAGTEETAQWPDPAPDRGSSIVCAAHAEGVIVARPMAARFPQKPLLLNASTGIRRQVGTPDYLPEETVQVAVSRFTVWSVRVVGDRIVLDAFENGRSVWSYDVTDELMTAKATGGGTTLSLAAQTGVGAAAFAYGQSLFVQVAGRRRVCNLDARITAVIALQAPGMTQGWIVTFERGAAFVALDGMSTVTIDDHLLFPRVTVTGDHRIVLVGSEEGLIARISGNAVVRLAWFAFSKGPGRALMPTDAGDVVAVLSEKGTIGRWRIPAW